MRKERKHFTPEEKVAILKRHLLDKVPVSDLCEELGLRPTVFYRWQKEPFENGAAAFQSQERPHRQVEEKQKRIEFLEKKVQTKDDSAIGYVTPNDMLAGRQAKIHAERDRKLEAARLLRKSRRQQAA